MAVGSWCRSLPAHTALIEVVKGHQEGHQAVAAAEVASYCGRWVAIRCVAMIRVLPTWAHEVAEVSRTMLPGHFRHQQKVQPLAESYPVAPGVHSDHRFLQRKQAARPRCPEALPLRVTA